MKSFLNMKAMKIKLEKIKRSINHLKKVCLQETRCFNTLEIKANTMANFIPTDLTKTVPGFIITMEKIMVIKNQRVKKKIKNLKKMTPLQFLVTVNQHLVSTISILEDSNPSVPLAKAKIKKV